MSRSKPTGSNQAAPYAADAKGRRYQPRYALAVECKDQRAQKRLYRRLRGMGLEPRVLVL